MIQLKYGINLIQNLREQEKKNEAQKFQLTIFALVCFGALGLSLLYSVLQALSMEMVINNEKQQLTRIENEYKKYKATRMIVDKADIELLDKLQNNRIFWTKKLAAMAFHLPDNYWITQFGHRPKTYTVSGYGYITPMQEQLVTIDDYLNQLRVDSTYNDVFKATYFNSTARNDEGNRSRVSFDYSSLANQ